MIWIIFYVNSYIHLYLLLSLLWLLCALCVHWVRSAHLNLSMALQNQVIRFVFSASKCLYHWAILTASKYVFLEMESLAQAENTVNRVFQHQRVAERSLWLDTEIVFWLLALDSAAVRGRSWSLWSWGPNARGRSLWMGIWRFPSGRLHVVNPLLLNVWGNCVTCYSNMNPMTASEIIRQGKPFLNHPVSVTYCHHNSRRAMAPILMFYLTLIPSLDASY